MFGGSVTGGSSGNLMFGYSYNVTDTWADNKWDDGDWSVKCVQVNRQGPRINGPGRPGP